MNRNFPSFDEVTAPELLRGALTNVRAQWNGIPTPLARYASSPALFAHALRGLTEFGQSSLGPLEREVVALTVARRNGCTVCLRLHRTIVDGLAAPEGFFEQLSSGGALDDQRLEALRRFTDSVLDHSGEVDAAVWQELRAQGFDHQQALDVVLGIAVYTLTTLANRLTEAHA